MTVPDGREQDINHMALTETNYSVAWNLVVKRYNNPRLQLVYNINARNRATVQGDRGGPYELVKLDKCMYP